MARISIGAVFSETFAFVKANWMQMLMWFGGALILLCIIGYLMLGSAFSAMAASAGSDPSAALGMFGGLFLFAIFAGVILYAASMLIWRGGLRPGEAPNVGWAVQAGPAFAFGMFVVMLVAYILVVVVGFILLLIFGAVMGLSGGFSPAAFQSGAAPGVGAILLIALFYIGFLLFLLWIQARFSVAGPVMADRLTRNPVTGLTESWKLTRASQWTIVGFYVVFTILTIIYMLVVGAVLGGVIGFMASGSTIGAIISMIISAAVIYLPLLMVSFSIPAGLYRALTPRTSGDVFA